ncbi:MAG: hypothetical protein RL427_402 [Bacteroidota bacterium]|jgi:hypothetical protein
MNNTASLLVLLFLAVTYVQSAHDKLFGWKENVSWLQSHFAKTILKDYVPISLVILVALELITSVLTLAGCVELLITGGKTYGLYGSVFSCICLLLMLVGQRLAKDYEGAKTIAIYYVPSVLAVWWLS